MEYWSESSFVSGNIPDTIAVSWTGHLLSVDLLSSHRQLWVFSKSPGGLSASEADVFATLYKIALISIQGIASVIRVSQTQMGWKSISVPGPFVK